MKENFLHDRVNLHEKYDHPEVLVYEYGARLDPESREWVWQQITAARRLYNELVACMGEIHAAMNAWVLERAGPHAAELQQQVERLTQEFDAARAANDEAALKAVASQRRGVWRELAVVLKAVWQEHKAEIRGQFLSRIGNTRATDTYRLRCRAVDEGLGWATATQVLDRALVAWKKSFLLGRPPRFARASERLQDSLVLQFTAKGGVPAARLLDGSHAELQLKAPTVARPRAYGEFRFRLGPAAEERYAGGTWQYHRGLPEGASVAGARLVCRRHADRDRWAIQLVVRLAGPLRLPSAPRATLAAVHLGWASDAAGRRVAAVIDAADPGLARSVRLPDSIEADLQRAAQVQAERDAARDIIAPEIKALRLGEEDGGERENGDGDETGLLYEELDALRKLAPQHIAIRRLHRLRRLLEAQGQAPTWLTQWARRDRQRWQATVGLARSARGRRRDLYRQVAHELASGYSAIVIEPLDLADAARIIDGSGERTEFTKAARAGRFVASLSEFDAALRWACAKHGTALFELTGKTASTCAHCGAAGVEAVEGQGQALQCGECGALTDRKSNAAAVAWQWASQGIEERIVDYHREQSEGRLAQQRAREDRRERMQAGRRTARTASEGATVEGSRDGQVGVADEDSGATDIR